MNNYRNIEGILEDDESRIRENSFALFAEYAFHIRQLQVRAGVRYEHLASDYFEEDKRIDEQSRTYNNVFPSISLSLPVGKAQLQLSYTGSIYHLRTGCSGVMPHISTVILTKAEIRC